MNNNDEKSKQEVQRLQQQMMQKMSETMSGSMKVMMASMVIFLPAFAILGMFYGDVVIPLPIPIPWLGSNSFIELYHETNWIGWYVLASLVTSIVLQIILKLAERVSK
jgi:uncharacterized membrane protein (DUF106 family)